MSSTPIQSTDENIINYHEGPWTIDFVNSRMRINSNKITYGEVSDLPEKTISMISENKKVLVPLNIGLYNFYYHCVTLLLRANRIDPDATMILDISGVITETESPYFKFLFKLLDDLNIKYEVLDPSEGNSLYINNFYILGNQQISSKDIDYFYQVLQRYMTNKEVEPFRNVYISRKYIGPRVFPKQKAGLNFNSDNRIIDEDRLEEYLSSCGFEIVYPEEFNDFIEQLNYFYEAKTIVSLTSSGMTNAIFMQPGGTMVELMTPLVLALGNPYGEEDIDAEDLLHHLYQIIAYNKKHTYIGIPNYDREPETIKKSIKNNEYLSSIIKEVTL